MADWNFYLAYNLFRIAGILQGIAKRVEAGTASSAQARQSAAGARPLAEMGWDIYTNYQRALSYRGAVGTGILIGGVISFARNKRWLEAIVLACLEKDAARRIAAEAGVSTMGVYSRFGGKDGLVDALLIRGFKALRDAIAPRGETDPSERLMNAGLRYRVFALGNSAHYLAMFDNAIHQDVQSPDVSPVAEASFDELVGHVRYGMVGGALLEGDAHEVAQQIWSAVHGAVQLEIKGMTKVPDPEQNYRALLRTIYRGLDARNADAS